MRAEVDQLERRTQRFAIEVFRLSIRIRKQPAFFDIARQVQASSSSVAANQRAVRRSRSWSEFAAKLQLVNEEIDETVHWLEMLVELIEPEDPKVKELLAEARELRAIYAKARKTTRLKRQQQKEAKGQSGKEPKGHSGKEA